MKILLTGTNGFIGKNLKIHLKNNHEIFEIKRLKKSVRKNKNIFYYDYEIKNLIDFFNSVKPDIVIHLASLFLSEHESHDINDLIKSNILFSSHIVEAMSKSKCRNIINTGTSWQNFNDEVYNPVNLYAATKEAFFKILYFYHLSHNINCVNIKLFDTYGQKDKRKKLFNILNQASKGERTIDMSDGKQKINLLHVNDVCKGFESALNLFKNRKTFFETYALSSREVITLKRLVTKYLRINKLNVKINWGKKKQREKEVVNPWSNYVLLPNWKQEIYLEYGLKNLYENN